MVKQFDDISYVILPNVAVRLSKGVLFNLLKGFGVVIGGESKDERDLAFNNILERDILPRLLALFIHNSHRFKGVGSVVDELS